MILPPSMPSRSQVKQVACDCLLNFRVERRWRATN